MSVFVCIVQYNCIAFFRNMRMCSVDSTGICWAVDKKNNVFRRAGAKRNNPIGQFREQY